MKDYEYVYCVKGLDKGITSVVGNETSSGEFWCVQGLYSHLGKGEWTRDPSEALEWAHARKADRLVSLRRNLEQALAVDIRLPH